jgi:GH24 family phage-related lysozyme (muramidase)
MWPSIEPPIFTRFTARFEGICPFMYLDVKGLVTTGIGNLIDPMGEAVGLPWVYKADGAPAPKSEIMSEWEAVKLLQNLKTAGGMGFANHTLLQLTPAGIDQLVADRLAVDENYLKTRFADWSTWPADAQLATLSMAWAMGPAFNFPQWEAAARAKNWKACALQCHISTIGNPGVVPRNAANVTLFGLAANTPDPSELCYVV